MSLSLLMLITLVIGFPNEAQALNERPNISQADDPDATPTPERRLKQEPTSAAMPSIVPPATKNPYSNLFRHGSLMSRAAGLGSPSLTTPPAQNPRIVCGLKVWHVDPDVDPKIRLSVRDQGIDFKIRRVAPSACR